jgi:hypothetical protein
MNCGAHPWQINYLPCPSDPSKNEMTPRTGMANPQSQPPLAHISFIILLPYYFRSLAVFIGRGTRQTGMIRRGGLFSHLRTVRQLASREFLPPCLDTSFVVHHDRRVPPSLYSMDYGSPSWSASMPVLQLNFAPLVIDGGNKSRLAPKT